jgi:hydrogenase nickel incorporation protein HypA/HybF
MHELSLCGAIADIVNRRAPDRRVTKIYLRIGQLRQVVPDTLTYCWSMVTTDTGLADSRLVVEHVAARLHCRTCGVETAFGAVPVFACAACGGVDVGVVAGEEFLVTALETTDSSSAGQPTR